MRKLIWLALAALVAGTVYAETSPGFSGSFEFYNTYNLDKPEDGEDFVIGNNYEVKIAVNGVIDEWTTVNAEITKEKFEIAERVVKVERGDTTYTEDTDPTDLTNAGNVEIDDKIFTDMDDYTIENTGDDKYGVSIAELVKSGNSENVYDTDEYDTMVLNEFTMTNDITGALGFADSPVAVSLTWGKTSLAPAKFNEVAGHSYLDPYATDSYLGIKISATILEKVKVVSAIFPETYLNDYYEEGRDKSPVGGIDMQFLNLLEGLNFNVFFVNDKNKDTDDDTKETEGVSEIGLTAGYSGIEDLNLGLSASYYLFKFQESDGVGDEYARDKTKFDIGISSSYSLMQGRLVPAVAVVIEEFPKEIEEDKKSPLKLYIGLDARFKLAPDKLDLVFNTKLPMRTKNQDEKDGADKEKYLKNEWSLDAGIEAFLGSVTYGLGYEYRDRNKYSPNGDDSTGLYFKVKASF